VYYLTSNFRFERPQSGRLRIHHQFGVEAFGIAEPEQDVECILLQMDFYRRCGVKDLALRINSLGDRESKQKYRDELVKFLSPKKDKLSEDSQRRLEQNPLRILDSKDPRDVEACKGAPPAVESLSEKSRQHFERVQQLLKGADTTIPPVNDGIPMALEESRGSSVPFEVDGGLVRGFDYYTDTLWEVTAGGLGAQNAIGGGGRYDNLVEMLGGRPTPGVGFGSGLERLLIALEMQGVTLPQASKPLVWLISFGDAAKAHNLQLLRELREAGIPADMDLAGRGMKGQMKLADREKAKWCVIVGDDELTKGEVQLKDMAAGQQANVPRGQLIAKLRS
jgi:histidyl-tRNA synthetase